MNDREIIDEFLIESTENLSHLEQEIVELETRPRDPALLGSIFRTVHSIKGTCGFLGFTHLERVTHLAENILSQLRNGERRLTPELTSLILSTMDAVKKELASIEQTSQESGDAHESLCRRLTVAAEGEAQPAVSIDTPLSETPPPDAPTDDALPSAGRSSIADSTVRVDVAHLDKLMNLVGELVLARNQILQSTAGEENSTLNATVQRLNLITSQLQEGVMKTRMQPIGVVWNKLPRVVRDLAAACGKQIQLEMEGTETELDKSIIEAIKDPLVHVVRNCCDHGIEQPAVRASRGKPAYGTLLLRAFHEGGQVNIEIADDGGGIDVARVKRKAVERGLIAAEQAERLSDRDAASLVFLPGFSTAETISAISGRGVGMDVVKSNIEKIGGVVDLINRPQQGITVKIKIPLTLAIIPGLVVRSGVERFVIPQASLVELLRLDAQAAKKQIEYIHETPVYRHRGTLLPIAHLNRVLQIRQETEPEAINIVVLQAEDRQFGLVVDAVQDTQEIVVKPLGKQLKGLAAYAGATIMGDGSVALILDVPGIGRIAGVLAAMHQSDKKEAAESAASISVRQSFLLFRAGSFERLAVPVSLVARLEEFSKDQIEQAGGSLVVQYRGEILPLVPLAAVLDPSASRPANLADPTQVVVFAEGDRTAGLIVDDIVDIEEESIQAARKARKTGLAGSAILGGKVTDFLDLPAVLKSAGETWSRGRAEARSTVLLADHVSFSRGLVRNYLELAGHAVIESVDVAEALAKLEGNAVTAVVASAQLPCDGILQLLDQLRHRPEWSRIPLIALAASRDSSTPDGLFDASVARSDRDGLLESLQKLSSAVVEPEETVGASR